MARGKGGKETREWVPAVVPPNPKDGQKWKVEGIGECIYDQESVDRVVRFFSLLHHTKGEFAGHPFVLSEWQIKLIIEPVFGWKRPDGTRLFRTVYTEIPKKNGKSALLSGILLYLMMADGEPEAETYAAAVDRAQAGIVFNAAKAMVEASPKIKKRLKVYVGHLLNPKNGSTMRALSKEAGNLDGINAHGVGIDELHRHKSREIWDVLEGAGGSRRQPLSFTITTAGVYDPHGIWWEVRTHARNVRDGVVQDPTFYPLIFEADEEKDDWEDREVWARVNPELGNAKKWDLMESLYRKARESPEAQGSFKRLQLNMVTKQVTRWIDPVVWNRCGEVFDESELEGRECFGGLDLSTTTDLTALALVFPPVFGDSGWKALMWFWLPGGNLVKAEKRDRVPYTQWKKDGLLETTDGDVIDYDAIIYRLVGHDRNGTIGLRDRYNIRGIAYDDWNATSTANKLQAEGLEMVTFRQGFKSYNEPMKKLEQMVIKGELNHGNNPILTWHMSNVALATDPAGNIKPDKSKAIQRIDGACALIMAVGLGLVQTDEAAEVVYQKGDLFL